MKKSVFVFSLALLAVAATVTSCGKKAETTEEAAQEPVAEPVAPAPTEMATDSTAEAAPAPAEGAHQH